MAVCTCVSAGMRACFCCHCQIADMKSCLHKQRLQMHADTSIRLIRPNESYMRWVRLGKTSIMCKLCNSAGIPPPCCGVLHCPASKPCTDGAQSQGLTHTAPCCPQVLLSSPLLMQSPTKLKSHCLIGRLHNDTSRRNKGWLHCITHLLKLPPPLLAAQHRRNDVVAA